MSPGTIHTAPDLEKSKDQLLSELRELRARIASLKECETRMKQLESAVKANEEMARQLLEQELYGVWVNVRGKVAYINEAGAKILGATSPGEVIGKSLFDVVHPDYWDTVRHRIETMGHGVRAAPMIEEKYVRVDGRSVDVDVWAMRFVYAGEPALLVAFRDITERKQGQAEMDRLNRSLQAISRCNEAVIHAKEESALLNEVCHIIVDVGGYLMAWVGYAMDDANKSIMPMAVAGIGEDYVEKAKVTWADTERGRGPVGTAVRTGKPYVIKHVTTDPDFAPWRELAIKMGYNSVLSLPMSEDDRAFGALTIYSVGPDAFDPDELDLLQNLASNITYGILSLRARKKREESEAALKAAMADAELYLDLMGHDITNLGQIGLGFIELARNIVEIDGKLDMDDIGLLDKARDSLKNISGLIGNVRKLQREKQGLYEPEVIDVSSMVREVVAHFQTPAGRNIRINYQTAGYCHVRANALLGDVFNNLIGNAVKHSKGDLDIDVRIDRVTSDNRPYCRIIVEDTGPGIGDQLKKKLFARFKESTAKKSGRGLGLYIVKTLVDDYHGRVLVEDRVPGDHTKGARFVILLPAVDT